ncbi:related to signal recognition particle 72 kDa protein [Cephalotrichum gorgonifer]|uniref:Signal recognition particle subunit SRP72 n=1 Tax=Cephalotrichum gorgonifer TaxID=2041049 RepID=A0AAE8MTZ2_9PEZI|nr:related to signal recognition particle 72 kDa protein [Cephalotrichum gorgonifer]
MSFKNPTATLNALLKAASIDDHEEILNTATAALKSSPTDVNLRYAQVVALLKLDRFDDALRAIETAGADLQQTCGLERAYALYKTGKLAEAREVLRPAVSAKLRGALHLDAQVAYRDERFDDAYAVIGELLDLPDEDDEEHDLRINISATAAQISSECGNVPNSVLDDDEDPDTFELAYNAACLALARGHFVKGVRLLTLATRLCDASEDLSDEEKQAEMVPILVQQAYAYSRMDMRKEAHDVYQSIDSSLSPDPESALLRGINSALLASDGANPFLLERIVSELLTLGHKVKLFGHQRALLNQLKQTLSLQCQKFSGVEKRTVAKAAPSIAPSNTHLGVLNVAAATQLASGKPALARCQELLQKRPLDTGLVLTAVQLAVRERNLGLASSVLQTFLDTLERADDPESRKVRYSPGLVALVVALHRAQGKERSVFAELSQVAAHARDSDEDLPESLLRGAGLELIKSHRIDEVQLASPAFESILERSPSDDVAAAGLIASSGKLESEVPSALSGKLPPVDELVSGVDVEALLDGGVVGSSATTQLKRKPAEEAERPASKRRRRVPKNAEPGKEPDPERWLPLRDRTSYRPRGKKGKKKALDSTQGGVVKEETLELVGGAGAVKVEKTTTSASSRKKKKGRK